MICYGSLCKKIKKGLSKVQMGINSQKQGFFKKPRPFVYGAISKEISYIHPIISQHNWFVLS